MELPIFKCVIDDNPDSDLEVNAIALVDRPAIERNFLAFKDKQLFSADEDRRIISGPAMLADFPIYRNDEHHGEYLVTFDAPTIFQIVNKFFKKGFTENFNLFHNENDVPGGVQLFESFIVDESRGILPMKGFEDAKDGSWFISAKIENDEVWERVKSGEFKGFSVEGFFKYAKFNGIVKPKPTEEEVLKNIGKMIEDFLSATEQP